MATTTIRLPEELKLRVKKAADRAGTTPHSFILEAIAEKAEQETLRADLDDTASRRYAQIIASGETIAWSDMRRYLEARVSGKKKLRPTARKLGR